MRFSLLSTVLAAAPLAALGSALPAPQTETGNLELKSYSLAPISVHPWISGTTRVIFSLKDWTDGLETECSTYYDGTDAPTRSYLFFKKWYNCENTNVQFHVTNEIIMVKRPYWVLNESGEFVKVEAVATGNLPDVQADGTRYSAHMQIMPYAQ